jgi:hypothetical protein
VRARFGRPGFLRVVLGSLLPLLDPALHNLLSVDRIEALTRPPLFTAPLLALTGIAALTALAAFLVPPRRALRLGLGLGAGYLLFGALAVLTPLGMPLLAPVSQVRLALPLLPTSHPPLLLGLFAALLVLEGLPSLRRWVWPGAAGLAVVYLLAGAAQYAVIAAGLGREGAPAGRVQIYPDGPWLTSWQVVVESPDAYALKRTRLGGKPADGFRSLPRWNDQALFLKLLGDPVVYRLYYRVFRHPVVRLEVSGAQITLLMQELQNQTPLVPGPTFYLETDLTGRNRFYQLQRFD